MLITVLNATAGARARARGLYRADPEQSGGCPRIPCQPRPDLVLIRRLYRADAAVCGQAAGGVPGLHPRRSVAVGVGRHVARQARGLGEQSLASGHGAT